MSQAAPHVFKIMRPEPSGPRVRTFSFSRMSTFTQCSQMYWQQYINRPDDVSTDTIYTVIGSRCHEALEDFYLSPEEGPGHYAHPYPALLDRWKATLKAYRMPEAFEELQALASDISHLEARCSAHYKGTDAIRTKDGRVPSNPSMTTEYKNTMAKLRIPQRKASVDRQAAKADALWKTISLAEVFAQTSVILHPYRHPEVMQDVLFIEFPLSDSMVWAAHEDGTLMRDDTGEVVLTSKRNGPHPMWLDPDTHAPVLEYIVNPVYLPDGSLFQGYIDIVARDPKGKIILGDHKTSKKLPEHLHVRRHQQLLMYAWAWHQLTGEWPELIGINHLKSNQMVTAQVDPGLALEAVARHMRVIENIDKEAFVPHDPFGFGAPCIDYRTGEPDCAYFKHCHADLWAEMHPDTDDVWDPFAVA